MQKVIVAMSGGVDSSVAAALLKKQGYAVEGVFMKNWSPESIQGLTDCPWEEDQADAAAVCQKLNIPFRSINFEREYKERVVDYFLAEYRKGRTPNPDVMCNKEIKFAAFLEAAENLGADFIATGHYARVLKNGSSLELGRGRDEQKDQSYFLYTLQSKQLRRTIFPLGELDKPAVRQIAMDLGLSTATKKDSQGICFIGHIDLKKFLQEHITAMEGVVYLLPAWRANLGLQERRAGAVEVGRHPGNMFYTIGERAGNIVDNRLYKKCRGGEVPPTYVLEKDSLSNIIYITDVEDDPHLYARQFYIGEFLLSGEARLPADLTTLTGQIRYQQKEVSPVEDVHRDAQGGLKVSFSRPVKAAATGQSLVLFQGERVIGGGVIDQVID